MTATERALSQSTHFHPMKALIQNTATIAVLCLAGSATGDIIYSNFRDIDIPVTFDGVFVDVDGANGWDINPFFGGVDVANSPAFQPVRTAAGSLSSILNLGVGDMIDAGRVFATANGYGGSQDHLAATVEVGKFVVGQTGYLGFRLNDSDYGWMRVAFDGTGSNAVILDWAYDNSGDPVVVGRINQSAPAAGAQLVTLSPQGSESFILGSLLSDTGGNVNSVFKTGTGTVTLSGSHSYSGITTVSEGSLLVNGSLTGNGAVGVSAGASFGGQGTVQGSTTIEGIHAPGSSPGMQTFASGLSYVTGSSLQWELTDNYNTLGLRGTEYDGINVTGGTLSIAAGVTSNLVFNGPGSAVDWTDPFWDSGRSWLVFDNAGVPSLASGTVFDTIQVSNDSLAQGFAVTGGSMSWSLQGSDLYLIYAIPEPCSMFMVTGLLGWGLLLRRREA